MDKYKIPEPGLEKIFRAEVMLGDECPLGEIGAGYQEIVPIKGGKFEGLLNGIIMDIGADWGLLYNNNINELNTKYVLKTDDGAYISAECSGKLIMSMEEMAEGGNSDCYFRQTIKFITGAEKYLWLNEIVAVAVSIITPDGNVCLDVYKLI